MFTTNNGNLKLNTEARDLTDTEYLKQAADFYENRGKSGFFKCRDNIKCHYKIFPSDTAKSTVVILPGRTEQSRKYSELILNLHNHNYAVFILDWRGQGLSDRLLKDPEKGHINNYDDYLSDLEYFIKEIVTPQATGHITPISHSMGGNILALYLIKHPKVFKKAVLSSPMLQLPLPLPEKITWTILKIAEIAGLGSTFVWGHGPWDENEINRVTRCEERREKEMEINKEYPHERVGGATFTWVRASLDAIRTVRKNAAKIESKILMLQSGDDQVVTPEGQRHLCNEAENCDLYKLKEAKHEIFQERDFIRNEAIEKIIDFIDN